MKLVVLSLSFLLCLSLSLCLSLPVFLFLCLPLLPPSPCSLDPRRPSPRRPLVLIRQLSLSVHLQSATECMSTCDFTDSKLPPTPHTPGKSPSIVSILISPAFPSLLFPLPLPLHPSLGVFPNRAAAFRIRPLPHSLKPLCISKLSPTANTSHDKRLMTKKETAVSYIVPS